MAIQKAVAFSLSFRYTSTEEDEEDATLKTTIRQNKGLSQRFRRRNLTLRDTDSARDYGAHPQRPSHQEKVKYFPQKGWVCYDNGSLGRGGRYS